MTFDPELDNRVRNPVFTDLSCDRNAPLLRLVAVLAEARGATTGRIALALMLRKDKHIIGENSVRNVSAGEVVGFMFDSRITYYRGLGVSMVEPFEIRVDGADPVPAEDLRFKACSLIQVQLVPLSPNAFPLGETRSCQAKLVKSCARELPQVTPPGI